MTLHKRTTQSILATDFPSELMRWFETGAEVSYDNLAEFVMMPEEKLLSIWREKRSEILANWKRKRRPGKPYIVNYIEEKKEYYRLRKLECPAIEAGYSFEDL
jgi:hypothetical protein